MDKQLGKLFVKFINECLRVADADPQELGRYMFVIYKEKHRLEWLHAFAWAIIDSLADYDRNNWIEVEDEAYGSV